MRHPTQGACAAAQGADGQQGSLCSGSEVAGRQLPACRAERQLACWPMKQGPLVGTGLGYCTDTPNDMDPVRSHAPGSRPQQSLLAVDHCCMQAAQHG